MRLFKNSDETFKPTAEIEGEDALQPQPVGKCGKAEIDRWNTEWLRYLGREWETQLTPGAHFRETPELPESPIEMIDVRFARNHTLRLYCDREALVGKRVMEIGCGCGNMGKLLARYVESYLGVDYSTLALKVARLVSPDNCTYVHIADDARLESFYGKVDTVIGRFFWIHQNMKLAKWNLELIDRFLEPGGRVYMDFYWGDQEVKQGVVLSPYGPLSKRYPSATFQYKTKDVEELVRSYPYNIVRNTISKPMQRRYIVLEKSLN